jgi:Flp pilus assembly protein TadG
MLRHKRHRGASCGQALAEFALVIPIFMLVVGGIVQFGIIFWGQNTLNQIVRDAGRYAVTEPDCTATPGGGQADILNKITAVAANASFAGTITAKTLVMPTTTSPDPVSDPVSVCPPTSNGQHVWLRITVQATVPIFFPLVPGNGNISSTAVFRMEPVITP